MSRHVFAILKQESRVRKILQASMTRIFNGSILARMHPRYQEHIHVHSCILCTCTFDYWNWTLAVDDGVIREHKDTRSHKNAYWEMAVISDGSPTPRQESEEFVRRLTCVELRSVHRTHHGTQFPPSWTQTERKASDYLPGFIANNWRKHKNPCEVVLP